MRQKEKILVNNDLPKKAKKKKEKPRLKGEYCPATPDLAVFEKLQCRTW